MGLGEPESRINEFKLSDCPRVCFQHDHYAGGITKTGCQASPNYNDNGITAVIQRNVTEMILKLGLQLLGHVVKIAGLAREPHLGCGM